MMEQSYGRIINISSRAWLGGPGQANYAASKGAVISLTRTLALEMARYGITANAIAPALVDTPLFRGLKDEVQERLIKTIPAKPHRYTGGHRQRRAVPRSGRGLLCDRSDRSTCVAGEAWGQVDGRDPRHGHDTR